MSEDLYKRLHYKRSRLYCVHYDRKFYSTKKDVLKSDSGIWYKPLDTNEARPLEQNAPEIMAMATKASCDGVYCGRPYLYPILSEVDAKKTFDFPAPSLKLPHVDIKMVEKKFIKPRHASLSFEVSGPSHISVYIMELPGGVVNSWSFGHGDPMEVFTLPTIHNPTFFIYYSHGKPNNTWEFTLDLTVFSNTETNSPLIKMGLAGHYLHGPNQSLKSLILKTLHSTSQKSYPIIFLEVGSAPEMANFKEDNQVTKELQKLNHMLPKWMITTMWSATYDEYFF